MSLSLFVLAQHDGYANDFGDNVGSAIDDYSSSPLPKSGDCVSRGCLGGDGNSSKFSLAASAFITTEDCDHSEGERRTKRSLSLGKLSSDDNKGSRPKNLEISDVIIPSCEIKSPYSSLKGKSPEIINVAIIGGGLLGVTTALDLYNMSDGSDDVLINIFLFERSSEILGGASQTAVVLHGGGGEYPEHTLTSAHCQMTGACFKATYPKIYTNKEEPVVFAPHPGSKLTSEDQHEGHRSAKKKRKALEKNPDSQVSANSQQDISPRTMGRAHPKLLSGVLSEKDIFMRNQERDALLKKCVKNSKICVISNFRILNNDMLFVNYALLKGREKSAIFKISSFIFSPLKI